MIKQLEKLLKTTDVSKNEDDLRICLRKMNQVLDSPEVVQVKKFVESQIEQTTNNLLRIGIDISNDYSQIEQQIRDQLPRYQYRAVAAKGWLDKTGDPYDKYGFPIFKKKSLKEALSELIIEDKMAKLPPDAIGRVVLLHGRTYEFTNPDGTTFSCGYTLDSDAEKEIESRLYTNNIMRWNIEKKQYDKLIETQRHFLHVSRFRSGIGKNGDWIQLKQSILQLCKDFLFLINTEQELRSLNIEIISYNYECRGNLKEASIVIKINDGRAIPFEGYRAYNLHVLLANPRRSIDIDNFKFSSSYAKKTHGQKNSLLHKDFVEMNGRIARGWNRYGFIHGANDLIRIPSSDDPIQHSYQINPEIKHLVNKEH